LVGVRVVKGPDPANPDKVVVEPMAKQIDIVFVRREPTSATAVSVAAIFMFHPKFEAYRE
jgi:hypothetical protein